MTGSGRWRHTQARPSLKATEVSALLAGLSQQSVPNSTEKKKKLQEFLLLFFMFSCCYCGMMGKISKCSQKQAVPGKDSDLQKTRTIWELETALF